VTIKPTTEPRLLTGDASRARARYTRDQQWNFMARAAEHDPLWFCIWNKRHLPEAADEWRDGLITGLDIEAWVSDHPTWFVRGEWDDGRYARPIWLTDAGRAALIERAPEFDMAPHHGGFVEPGYVVTPLTPAEAEAFRRDQGKLVL